MTYESIAVANDNGIARITLNRPDRLNSFTRAMHAELRDALADLGEARVVIITGAGGDAVDARDHRLRKRGKRADQRVPAFLDGLAEGDGLARGGGAVIEILAGAEAAAGAPG